MLPMWDIMGYSWDGSVRVPRNVYRTISEGAPCTGFPLHRSSVTLLLKTFRSSFIRYIPGMGLSGLSCPLFGHQSMST